MTKEQYLAIRAAWAAYFVEGKHKKHRVTYPIYKYDSNYNYTQIGEGYDMVSDLTIYHHYIYSLLRKKDLSKAFSEKSLEAVRQKIKWVVHYYTFSESSSNRKWVDKLIVPFGDQFTVDDLIKLLA